MKTAIMQPYLFPYIGYFQLAKCSDVFVLYDYVNYIKRGYINRNSILMDGEPRLYTVPVPGGSQNTPICELSFSNDVRKVQETIRHAYAGAPHFEKIFPLVNDVLQYEERGITELCQYSLERIFEYLGEDLNVIRASDVEHDTSLDASDRLIAITKSLGSSHYINTIGGKKLYDKESFAVQGVQLDFLEPLSLQYRQRSSEFVPNLSFIDVLMNCEVDLIKNLLNQYRLV